MYRRSLLRSFSGCVVYIFRTDEFASVWTLTFCISRNSPLKTNLPALEWHATSACEPFCSSFWNRMSKPLQFLSFSLPWTLHLGSVYLGSWMNPSSLKAVSTRRCTIVVHSEAPWTCQTLQLGKRFANRCAGWLLPPSSKRCPSCSTMAFSGREASRRLSRLVWYNSSGEGMVYRCSRFGFSLYTHDELFAAETLSKYSSVAML